MKDLNIELWKLGVTAKPSTMRWHRPSTSWRRFMRRPISPGSQSAGDGNHEKVAERHNLRCLLHEKPFAGVNGSGKHDNWSISTDTGVNLLDPGETPNENIQFLLILACVMKAVDTHADLLRRSASNVGNDLRLGANEAPPAIVSIFLGTQLEDVVRQLVETGEARSCLEGNTLRTGVSTVPDLHMDATDRNRTSPFAFTGTNSNFGWWIFGFLRKPTTAINASWRRRFARRRIVWRRPDRKIRHGSARPDQGIYDAHQRIIFNGDGYSQAWMKEARRRGLPNFRGMIDSIEALTTDKAILLYERFGIYNRAELESRKEILYETYVKTINIEAKTMIDMASREILPAVIRYSRSLAETVKAEKEVGADASVTASLLREINERLTKAAGALEGLKWKEKEGQEMKDDVKGQAFSTGIQSCPLWRRCAFRWTNWKPWWIGILADACLFGSAVRSIRKAFRCGCTPQRNKKNPSEIRWVLKQGYKDSNLEMTESESVALPFGDSPKLSFERQISIRFPRAHLLYQTSEEIASIFLKICPRIFC